MKTTLALNLLFSLICKVVLADLHQGSIFGFGGSDPHVVTWTGVRFELQGGNKELSLVQTPEIDINIRTKKNDWWSYPEAAVLRIGDETIEVRGGKDQSHYWINGEEGFAALEPMEEMQVFLIQGREVTIRQLNAKQFQLRVDLGNDEGVVIETFQEFVRVDIQANTNGGSSPTAMAC